MRVHYYIRRLLKKQEVVILVIPAKAGIHLNSWNYGLRVKHGMTELIDFQQTLRL
jgi:hypothetical protein